MSIPRHTSEPIARKIWAARRRRRAAGLIDIGDKYLDGREVANSFAVDLG